MLGDFKQPLPLPVVCPACMKIMSLTSTNVAARTKTGARRFGVKCTEPECDWHGWTLAGPEPSVGGGPSLGTREDSGPASEPVEGHRVVSLAAHRERRAS